MILLNNVNNRSQKSGGVTGSREIWLKCIAVCPIANIESGLRGRSHMMIATGGGGGGVVFLFFFGGGGGG